MQLLSPQVRQYLYTVTSAVIAILVTLKVVDPELVPLGLNLAASLLGLSSSTVAALAVNAQRKDGTLP
jgi:hypothetical protein